MQQSHPFDSKIIEPYIQQHPHRVLFITGSGAHLYGFPSPDSDYDLRGMHATDPRDALSLSPPRETYEVLDRDSSVEMDIVTHDVRKYVKMLLNKNGYVLEQICSPLVVTAWDGLGDLQSLARRCVTRYHHYHFERFAQNQWDTVSGPSRGTVKGMLYTYRPLMAGVVLMTEGIVESNIVLLNERFRFSFIDDLVAAKVSGAEKQALNGADMAFHESQFESLCARLQEASGKCDLPESPPSDVRQALDELVVAAQLGERI